MKLSLRQPLVLLLLLCAAPQAFGSDEPVSCADHTITASAVRTTGDVQVFVQCAYEFVQEAGFEEARRAFHEDERWRSGPIIVVVSEVVQMPEMARAFVFPPAPSQEGQPWGPMVDVFGNDYVVELHRILSVVDEGWLYYASRNPATDREEPKASYVKSIDWDGNPAAIGAGIYRRDFPSTCEAEEVNAMQLEAEPSTLRLQEFVRCAAMELEANGYFAIGALSSDPRWRNQSIYVFGLDTYGNALFSGNLYSQPWWGALAPELNDHVDGPFGGQDVVSVGDDFVPVLLDAQSLHRNNAGQGGFREEDNGLWPADSGRLRLLSGRCSGDRGPADRSGYRPRYLGGRVGGGATSRCGRVYGALAGLRRPIPRSSAVPPRC